MAEPRIDWEMGLRVLQPIVNKCHDCREKSSIDDGISGREILMTGLTVEGVVDLKAPTGADGSSAEDIEEASRMFLSRLILSDEREFNNRDYAE